MLTEDERLLADWDLRFLIKYWQPPTKPTPTIGGTTWVYEDNDVPQLKCSYETRSTGMDDCDNRLDTLRDITVSE